MRLSYKGFFSLMQRAPLWIGGWMLCICACEEDDRRILHFPTVITEAVDVQADGAVFSGEILDSGGEIIEEKGFVWRLGAVPTTDDNSIQIEDINRGRFNALVSSGLGANDVYYVRAYAKSGGVTVYGDVETFTAKGSAAPVIFDFFPSYGPIGTLVTINGKNFGHGARELTVKIGDVIIPVKNVTDTQITFPIPVVVKPSQGNIFVETGKMSVSAGQFEIFFPWLMRGNFSVPTSSCFTDDELIYFLPSLSSEMEVLNPQTMEWLNPIPLPAPSGWHPNATVVDGVSYIILGDEIYSFDMTQQSWTLLSKKWVGTDYIFVIKRNLYAGSISDQSMFSLNLDTRLWTSKAPLESSSIHPESKAFTIRGKAYVNRFDGLWSYDPESDTWASLGKVGGIGSRTCSFAIGDKIYAGLGDDPDWQPPFEDAQLFSYDVLTGERIGYRDCPYRLPVAASIAVGNKGYIFAPWVQAYHDFIVYEFDPSKN